MFEKIQMNKHQSMNELDIIGIHYWIENGKKLFRCRGIGKTYDQFYEWLEDTSYVCDGEDMPWDYFHFTNEEDEQKILEKYECWKDE